MNRAAVVTLLAAPVILMSTSALAKPEIARAASTPDTPKNWQAPAYKMHVQALVDQVVAGHPELVSISVHAVPPGAAKETWTMVAGTFPDRIGNESGESDIHTAKAGVTQIESKWGTPAFGHKVSVVLPLKNSAGTYLPATLILGFMQGPETQMSDIDFLKPAAAIRDGLMKDIPTFEALFSPER